MEILGKYVKLPCNQRTKKKLTNNDDKQISRIKKKILLIDLYDKSVCV